MDTCIPSVRYSDRYGVKGTTEPRLLWTTSGQSLSLPERPASLINEVAYEVVNLIVGISFSYVGH